MKLLNKYLDLLEEIYNQIVVKEGDADILQICKEYKANNSTASILIQMKVIESAGKGKKRNYKWVGKQPDYDMADDVIYYTRKRDKECYKRKVLGL